MKKIIKYSFLFMGMLLITSCGNSEGGGDNDGVNKNTKNSSNNANNSITNSNGIFTRDDITGIITQKKSKLTTMWQDDKEIIGLSNTRNEAKSYCASLKLGGYSDWHLPASAEIKGIYNDKTKKIESIFKNMNNVIDIYWVSEYTNGLPTSALFSSTKFEVKQTLGDIKISIRCHRDVKNTL